MGKGGNAHDRAKAKARDKGNTDKMLPNAETLEARAIPRKPLGQRLLEFVEQPLFTLPVGIVGGIVGLLFYTPMLALCGLCVLLAFHRAKVVSGESVLRIQLPAYVVLSVVVMASLYGLHVVVMHKLAEDNASLARRIAEYVKQLLLPPRSFVDIAPNEFGVESNPSSVNYGRTLVNVSCTNVGTDIAWLTSCGARVFVDDSSPIDFREDRAKQEQYFNKFIVDYKEQNPPRSLMLGVFTWISPSGPPSTKPLIDALDHGDKTLVVVGHAVYKDKDKDGEITRTTDLCDFMQPPVTSPQPVWMACQVHSGEVTMQR